jgi:putative transposase
MALDEQLQVFRERPLQGTYPHLWLEAKVERVREPDGVRHKVLVNAYGVHETGWRGVVGLDVGEAKTKAFWRSFLRSLRARGLDGVQLVISDAHTGLTTKIAKVFGCHRQRCTVRFPRDMLRYVNRANRHWYRGRSARSSPHLGRRSPPAAWPRRRPAPPHAPQRCPRRAGRKDGEGAL